MTKQSAAWPDRGLFQKDFSMFCGEGPVGRKSGPWEAPLAPEHRLVSQASASRYLPFLSGKASEKRFLVKWFLVFSPNCVTFTQPSSPALEVWLPVKPASNLPWEQSSLVRGPLQGPGSHRESLKTTLFLIQDSTSRSFLHRDSGSFIKCHNSLKQKKMCFY